MTTALGKYRTPDLILDLVIDKAHNPYFNLHRHQGVEIYASSPSFLISAGGIYNTGALSAISDQNTGWALPTTFIPSKGGTDRVDLIRFEGDKRQSHRSNTCVAPGFACGLSPVIPSSMPASCREDWSGWTFFNFASPKCPWKYGFYGAMYHLSCDTDECRDAGGQWGFMEAREANAGMDYETFKNRVLNNNNIRQFFSAGRVNEYVSSYGQRTRFHPQPKGLWQWSIQICARN